MPRFTKEQLPLKKTKKKRCIKDGSFIEEAIEVQVQENNNLVGNDYNVTNNNDASSSNNTKDLSLKKLYVGLHGILLGMEVMVLLNG